jgi:hypothetical protein
MHISNQAFQKHPQHQPHQQFPCPTDDFQIITPPSEYALPDSGAGEQAQATGSNRRKLDFRAVLARRLPMGSKHVME